MIPKRILTIQDLSCVGQCSLTVALPVLSACGIEACVLPTAVLSNHTAFQKWSFLDLTPEINHIMDAWRANNFKFDAFLLGYLGSVSIMEIAKICFRDFAGEEAKIIIDPAFADNGRLYAGFDDRYVSAMADLMASADILLPNLTEACFLTKTPYRAEATVDFARETVRKLAGSTDAVIVLTGAERDGQIGELICSGGEFTEVWAEKLPRRFHGTGDIFSSVFTAVYLQSGDMAKACAAAGDFVASCIRATDEAHTYGVSFETVLRQTRTLTAPVPPAPGSD